MEWIGLNDLREKYLAFFESKDHLRAPSASLVPKGDASLLLINSGMAPLKKYFTGEQSPPSRRMATCQKCVRTPDIESVGIQDRYGTCFEMLGNFSFGDYFKRQAIAWAWEFITEVLGIPLELLYFSVFEQDDEAWDIWTKEVGVPENHMVRMGREDNFWEHAKGPCGPCSEIYYDRGAEHGCGQPDCAVGCDCDRFMEFWNLVFTQFDSDGEGNYTELDSKNIDTGMGLERLALLMQGVGNIFEIDTMQNIMKHVSYISGITYKENLKSDISLRIITDHVRSTTMMIGDGVLPSNEGRGYVLRRLLRRAARHGKLLGIEQPFLSEIATTVIAENAEPYPVLTEKKDYILRVIANEEENFGRTIDAGLSLLNKMIADCAGVLSGEDAFRLSDTFGFPIDLTKEILAEQGMAVDEVGFAELARQQRERSRSARKEANGWDSEVGIDTKELPLTEFLGYEQTRCEAKVLAVFDDIVVLDQTPFYPEGGGQCGDKGRLNDCVVAHTSQTPDGVILHHCEENTLQPGDNVHAIVNNRTAIQANHTAAHLLQAALKTVLGAHVEQAGQSVTADSVRFDFTHFSAMTGEELASVEKLVNKAIWQALPVTAEEMSIEEAKVRDALALFGEKYGEMVRVVNVPEVSVELCGGTHVSNTGNLGLFAIMSESSVASGVRRIEALTAANAYAYYNENKQLLADTANMLKANNSTDLIARASAVATHVKELERDLAIAQEKLLKFAVQDLLQNAKQFGSVKFVCGELGGDLRQACDSARQSGGNIVALFAQKTDKGTLQLAACATPEAVRAGAHAGNLAKAAAQAAGGKGGGKPDMAMAGGKDPTKLKEALLAGEIALKEMLNA